MIRALFLALGVSCLAACGVGEMTTGGANGQTGQQESQGQSSQSPSPSNVNTGSNINFNEGNTPPDAGQPTLADGPGLARDEAIPLELVDVERCEGGGVLLRYKPAGRQNGQMPAR